MVKKSKGARYGERGGRAMAHCLKEMRVCAVLLEVNASFLVIFV
jgi:hypothetical protein